jgi:hypothetical protein
MTYNLFIDDERDLQDVTWMPRQTQKKYHAETWVIARNMDSVQSIVARRGIPKFISFDHDLGEQEPTGYDIAKWFVDLDMVGNQAFLMPEDFSFAVHSQNPVGKKNIESYLNNYINFKKGN